MGHQSCYSQDPHCSDYRCCRRGNASDTLLALKGLLVRPGSEPWSCYSSLFLDADRNIKAIRKAEVGNTIPRWSRNSNCTSVRSIDDHHNGDLLYILYLRNYPWKQSSAAGHMVLLDRLRTTTQSRFTASSQNDWQEYHTLQIAYWGEEILS